MMSRMISKNLASKVRCMEALQSPMHWQGHASQHKPGTAITLQKYFQCQTISPAASVFTPFRNFSTIPPKDEPPKVDDEAELEKEKEEKEKKRQRQKKWTNYTLVGMSAAFAGALVYAFFEWGRPRIDDDGNVVVDEFTEEPFVMQHIKRAWKTLTTYEKILKEPSRELLLPPPLKAPYYQPPFTLVLEMTGILVNPEWTYSSGWRFKKRQFVEYLLHQCAASQNFEIVIYTKEQGLTAYPLLNNLDPEGFIMYRLFRDSTRYEDGQHIKDLNMLNRDLRTVIHVDWDRKACQSNPDNCLVLKKWDGDSKDDRALYDLANFLNAIAAAGSGTDVRNILRNYAQYEDPLEAFKENQRKLAEQEKENELARQQQLASKKSSLFSSYRFK